MRFQYIYIVLYRERNIESKERVLFMITINLSTFVFSLKVGDQIIEINSYNTTGMTHGEAIALIQNGGPTVHLLIKRTGKPPPHIGKET